MQKIKRVTLNSNPSMLCNGLGESYQRKRKARAVIVSVTALGFPGRQGRRQKDVCLQHTGAILYVESLGRLKDRKSWKGYTTRTP